MKSFYLALFYSGLLALSEAAPKRRYKFTRGNSGTSGRAGGDETSVDTESKVQAGDGEDGIFAETRGVGNARGRGESTLDLESWAGFEGWKTGGAGGGGRAIGDETAIDTDSDVFIGEQSGRARSGSQGTARGLGESALDLESFGSLDGWSSGSAGGGGRAVGDQSEVDSESSVNSEFGRGTLSKAESRGAAAGGDGRSASLNLENFAGVDETNTDGKASVT
ncbi:MAG: hypothetical protein GY696_19215, partial [Gammaproteobacteria bacterium]|nr:hypothetical protein [Gammaproteobacteria bacterium]